MDKVLVVLASLTSANRIKKYMQLNFDVKVIVMQTPKDIQLEGCGYCVKADYKDLDKIYDAIEMLDISSRGAFNASNYMKIR